MSRTIRTLLTLVAALALAVGIAACGGDDQQAGGGGGGGGGQPAGGGGGKEIQRDQQNASTTVTVGSKNFPEQFILGEIYAQALGAAGYNVKKQLNLGSEQIAFKALKAGNIDAYPEYTGTALTSFFNLKTANVPKEPDQAYQDVKQRLAKERITAMPRTPFENTYRLGLTKQKHQQIGAPKTMSELAQKSGQLSITGYPECRQRTDCLLGVEQTYNADFKKFVASTSPYEVLDKGQADVAFVFSTDAQLATGDYVTVEDDKKLFPPYNITFMVRDQTLQKLGPEGQQVITQVQEPLTEQVMQELNSRVVLDKQKPERVAADYLREAGFVK